MAAYQPKTRQSSPHPIAAEISVKQLPRLNADQESELEDGIGQ